jgi:hypothetical protein
MGRTSENKGRRRVGRVSYYFRHGAWHVYYRDGGRQGRRRVGQSEQEASQVAAQINAQLVCSIPTPFYFTPVSVPELRRRFLDHHELALRSWRLSGPAGLILSYVSFADGDWLYSDPALKLQPGDYWLTVFSSSVAPTASIGGPTSVNEGETIDLTGSGSDVAADTLTYAWDFDGDGVSGETGAVAANGDENLQNPTLDAANLDGPGVHVDWLCVSDEASGVMTVSASITLVNVAPTASFGGPYSAHEGQTVMLAGSASGLPKGEGE